MSTFFFLKWQNNGSLRGAPLELFGTKMVCGSLSHVRAGGCFLATTKVLSNLRVCVANCALLSHSWLCQFKVANQALVCITRCKLVEVRVWWTRSISFPSFSFFGGRVCCWFCCGRRNDTHKSPWYPKQRDKWLWTPKTIKVCSHLVLGPLVLSPLITPG